MTRYKVLKKGVNSNQVFLDQKPNDVKQALKQKPISKSKDHDDVSALH